MNMADEHKDSKPMKVVLVGASGFIGTRLLDLLKSDPQDYTCKNLDLLPSHFFNDVTVIGDVRKREDMDEALKGADLVVLLAAQHRDDVTPIDLYYDTNVHGMEVTLKAMEKNGCKRILFFSSVAIYGLNKPNPDEHHPADPFNHYGKSKWQAEQVLQNWYRLHSDWNINIIRPTVVFGERNRGNVYNLLRQISQSLFMMVGNGKNRKSMAYVGNIVAFAKYLIDNVKTGYNVYNYTDEPTNTMNELVEHVEETLKRRQPKVRLPYWVGMCGGYCFDALSFLTGKKYPISSVRMRKFCANTLFNSEKAHSSGFKAPFTLNEGLVRTLTFEFINPPKDGITFKSE